MSFLKKEARVLGVDDGFFKKRGQSRVLVVGVVTRGALDVEGVVSCFVRKDGFDSTAALSRLVRGTKHYKQLRVIMLQGSTLAGFNVVDCNALHKRTGIPVICILRRQPDATAVENAVRKLPNAAKRLALLEKNGPIRSYKKLFFQSFGISDAEAQRVIDATLRRSNVPEPVRLAHLVASGITTGESTRRA